MESKELKKTRLKPDERIKSERISFRITGKEKAELEGKMNLWGFKNKTDFIKFCIFEKTHTEEESIAEIKKFWEQVDVFLSRVKQETLNCAYKTNPTSRGKNGKSKRSKNI